MSPRSPSPIPPTRLAALERRLRDEPASPSFVALGEAYRGLGRLEDAEQVLRAGLGHRPEHHSARVALGRLLLELGREAEAELELRRVVEAAPDNLLGVRLLEEARLRREGKVEVPAAAEHREAPPTTRPVEERVDGSEPAWQEDWPVPSTASDVAGATLPLGLPSERADEAAPPPPPGDGLSTEMLAEMFLAGGDRQRALEIFRDLADREPHRKEWAARVQDLEAAWEAPATPGEGLGSPPTPGTAPEPLPEEIWEAEEGTTELPGPAPPPAGGAVPEAESPPEERPGTTVPGAARQEEIRPAAPPQAGPPRATAGEDAPGRAPGPEAAAPPGPAATGRAESRDRRLRALRGFLAGIERSRRRDAR